jgi:hypothetical protein
MALLRHRQRPVTAILPHANNRRIAIPNRAVTPPPSAPQPPDGSKPIDATPTDVGTGWTPFGGALVNWAFSMPPGDAFNPLRFNQLLLGETYFYRMYARGDLTPTFRWRLTGDPAGDVVLDTEGWYSGTFTVVLNDGAGSAPRLTHTADELGKVECIDIRFWSPPP